ncbi:MAG: hypothetical protein Kow00123_13010 [Anaerolineales bacterium]
MDGRQFAVGAIVFALICWLTLAALVTGFSPTEPLIYLFYALLALGVSGTLMPVVYYLHVRFGGDRDNPRWFRYIRQSLWIGALVAFYLWLNSLRALSVPALLLGICIAALVELVILRPSSTEG